MFTQFWKVPIRFIMPVRPPFHTPTTWIFDEFDTGDFYDITKIQIWLQSDNNIRYVKWTPKYVYIVESSMKYFTAQQYESNILLHFTAKPFSLLFHWQWHMQLINTQNTLLHFQGNSDYMKMAECCVIHTVPVLCYDY